MKTKCAFVYAGIGTQWKTMGVDLIEAEPIFKETVQACDTAFKRISGRSIMEEMLLPRASSRMDNLLIAHPCNVAIQIGLTELLKSWGITPHGVVGHSSGEIAAAQGVGILSLSEAMELIRAQCQLMEKINGKGILAHIGLPEADVRDILDSTFTRKDSVWIAAVNSPSATVITGAEDRIKPLIAQLGNEKIFCRILKIDIPYHCPMVDPFTIDLSDAIIDLIPKPETVPIYSTLRGGPSQLDDFGPAYWPEHIQKPVRFLDAIQAMIHDGYETFIEISPHAVLSGAIDECAASFLLLPALPKKEVEQTISYPITYTASPVITVSTLKRETKANDALTDNLAVLVSANRMELSSLPDHFQNKVKSKCRHILHTQTFDSSETKHDKAIPSQEKTQKAGPPQPIEKFTPSYTQPSSPLEGCQNEQYPDLFEKMIRQGIHSVTYGKVQPPSDNTVGFLEMGLTSQHAVRLANFLSQAIGRRVPPTTMFDRPHIDALVDFLKESCPRRTGDIDNSHDTPPTKSKNEKPRTDNHEVFHMKRDGSLYDEQAHPIKHHSSFCSDKQFNTERPPDSKKAQHSDSNSKIAVIGMGCRFPGGANSPEAFHKLVMERRCAINPVSSARWHADFWLDNDPDSPGKAYSQMGGFLEDELLFNLDAPFFRISPKEALSLDPQQRLLLETVWEAFEDAAIPPTQWSDEAIGVYVGISTMDYMGAHLWSTTPEAIDAYSATGSMYSAAAGRIAYHFNLRGPVFSLDTACSSSLVALDSACRALKSGSISGAIVAGVNAMVHPHMYVYFSKLGALSPSGRCRTFDAEADGYVRGEGAGAILLKPLDKAMEEGDRILAVIEGSAVNHDGKSSSFTAPNGTAQQRVIRQALENANVLPKDVGYVEAHGTGTRLGDPIEMQALGAVYGVGHTKDAPLRVGSVKANIGHLEAAAGMASLIKTILLINQGVVPGQINFEAPNPLVQWDEMPLAVSTSHVDFEGTAERRIAGVSAFGFSGTNVHVIVSQPPHERFQDLQSHSNPSKAEKTSDEFQLSISARTPEALEAYCQKHIEFLTHAPSTNTKEANSFLANLCYTAHVGRTRFPHECVVKGRSRDEFIAALEEIISAATEGTLPAHARLELKDKEEKKPFSIDTVSGKKIGIPTYPFQRKRFWMNPVESEVTPNNTSYAPKTSALPLPTTTVSHFPAVKNENPPPLFPGQRVFVPPILSQNPKSDVPSNSTLNVEPDITGEPLIYHLEYNDAFPSFIPEHIILGAPIVPAAAYLSHLLSFFIERYSPRHTGLPQKSDSLNGHQKAAERPFQSNFGHPNLTEDQTIIGSATDIRFTAPLVMTTPKQVQLICSNAADNPDDILAGAHFKIISRSAHTPWETHCKGVLQLDAFTDAPTFAPLPLFNDINAQKKEGDPIDLIQHSSTWPSHDRTFKEWIDQFCRESEYSITGEQFYSLFNILGYGLGENFCRIQGAWSNSGQAVCRINLKQVELTKPYHLYPGFIDAMLQSLVFGAPAVLKQMQEQKKILIPFALEKVDFLGLPTQEDVICHVKTTLETDFIHGDITVYTPNGLPLIHFSEVTVRLTEEATLLKNPDLRTENKHRSSDSAALNEKHFPATYTIEWKEIDTTQNLPQDSDYNGQEAAQPPKKSAQTEHSSTTYLIITSTPDIGSEIVKRLIRLGIDRSACKLLPKTYMTQGKTSFESLIKSKNNDHQIKILYLWETDALTDLTHATHLFQTLVETGIEAKFFGITQGAYPIENDTTGNRKKSKFHGSLEETTLPGNAIQQAFWGFGKTVALEHSDLFGGFIDLSSRPSPIEIDQFVFDLTSEPSIDLRAYRVSAHSNLSNNSHVRPPAATIDANQSPHNSGNFHINRDNRQCTVSIPTIQPTSYPSHPNKREFGNTYLDPRGTYLITGAFGGLGLPITEKLLELGAKNIRLLGRRAPSSEFLNALTLLKQQYDERSDGNAGGDTITIKIVPADVSDRDDLACVLDAVPNERPLKGVLHLAGIRRDALLPRQTSDSITDVLMPKALGAWNLHTLLQDVHLDFFILFSSAASFLGSQGQANYAAANAFLDGLTCYRHAMGLPALSIQWGPWAETGMAAVEGAVQENLTRLGFSFIAPEQGVAALEKYLTADSDVHFSTPPFAVLNCNWKRYLNQTEQYDVSLFKEIGIPRPIRQPSRNVDGYSKALLWQGLQHLSQDHRKKELVKRLSDIAVEVSGIDIPIDPVLPLMEQGFDSLMAVELRNQLQKQCGFSLPVTLLFTYPDVTAISECLFRRAPELSENQSEISNHLPQKPSLETERRYSDDSDPEQPDVKDTAVQSPSQNKSSHTFENNPGNSAVTIAPLEKNDTLVSNSDQDAEIDFSYLDELTPDQLNALISQDLDQIKREWTE